MACPRCKSERIENGRINGQYEVLFEADSSTFFHSKKSSISAKV